MGIENILIKQYSQRSILLTFEQPADENLLKKLVRCRQIINEKHFKSILYINLGYNSLLINYVSTIDKFYDLKNTLLELISEAKFSGVSQQHKILLPVCYDESFGLDLEELSEHTNLSPKEIIKRHSSTEYLIYFLGFLPGFPYLLNLDSSLYCPRKSSPRQNVLKGSVGIAGQQTGIYPQESPGGWQIIGNCPISIFGNYWQNYSPFSIGDKLQFYSVSLDEYHQIKHDFETHNFKLKKEKVG